MEDYNAPSEFIRTLLNDLPDLEQTADEMRDKLESLPSKARLSDKEIQLIYSIGYSVFQQGKIQEAKSIFHLLLIYRPTDIKVLTAFSICCKRIGNFEDACICFMLLLMLEPAEIKHAQQIAECLAAMGSKTMAIEAVKVIISALESGMYTDESARIRATILKSMIDRDSNERGMVYQ